MQVGDKIRIIGSNDVNNFYKADLSRHEIDGEIMETLENGNHKVTFNHKFALQIAEFRPEDLRLL